MSRVVVQTFVSLDGVAQAPGGEQEDTENGFPYGGWQFEYDFDITDLLLEWESKTDALLLGRKTYDIWSGAWAVWPEDAEGLQGEFTRRYNRVTKYVASHTLTDPTWKNTEVITDVPAAVKAIEVDNEIRVWGSTGLIPTLAEHDLVDEYRIITYPVILGTGKKLFGDGFPHTKLALHESYVHPSGALVSIYRRG